MKNNICLITIGTEIQKGYIKDINSSFIAEYLSKAGLNVSFSVFVDDNIDNIKSALDFAFSRLDTVITTGGLGPTRDDLTRSAVSEYFGLPLIENKEERNRILNILNKKNIQNLDCNQKQALFPEGARILINKNKTASGFCIEKNNKKCISLPGVPAELRNIILSNDLKSYIIDSRESFQFINTSFNYLICSYGESQIENILIENQEKFADYSVSIICNYRMILLYFTPVSKDHNENKLYNDLVKLFGKINIIRASSPFEALFSLLKQNDYTIAFAESATGGLLSFEMSRLSGISSVFNGSIVCYSNKSKISLLGVNEYDISKYGAVSKIVAQQMAEGVIKALNADIGIGITGIAGPKGETPYKPLGLFYISAFCNNTRSVNYSRTAELILEGDRHTRQYQAVSIGTYMAIELINHIMKRRK